MVRMKKRKSKTSRADGLGHWPRGKRRNIDVAPPKGFSSVTEFMSAVREFCEKHGRGRGARDGAKQRLASELDVHHSTVGAWISGEHWPGQKRVDQIAKWWAKELLADGKAI